MIKDRVCVWGRGCVRACVCVRACHLVSTRGRGGASERFMDVHNFHAVGRLAEEHETE